MENRVSGGEARFRITLVFQVIFLSLFSGILLTVLFWEREPLSSIGLHPPGFQTFFWGIALALFFIYVFSPAAYRALRHLKVKGFEKGLSRLAGLPVWYLFSAVLIGASAEEVLYRGYAIERLASWTGSYWLGGLTSLIAFGVAHVPMWGFWPALTTLVSGGILTAFYIWQQDLVLNITAHLITDFVGIVLPQLFRRNIVR